MKFRPENPSLRYGIFLTLLAYFIFAIASAFVKLANNVPTIQIIFFQSTIPLFCLLPTLFLTHKISDLKPISISAHLIRDISGVLSYFTYFLAIKLIGLVDATVLSYTAPFYIPFIWSIWTKEKIQKEVWLTIIIGFIGIIIILKPGKTIFNINSLIGVSAGILSAVALTGVGILNKKKELLTNTLFYNFFVSSLIALPFTIYYWQPLNLEEYLLLFGIGIGTFIAQLFLTEAYRHGTASFLSPLCYSIVVYTAFIGWIFFKSPPDLLTILGMILIIVGGTATFIFRKKPETSKEFFEANHIQKPWWKFWNKKPPKA